MTQPWKTWLSITNWVDGSSTSFIARGQQAGDLVVSNLQSPQIGTTWRGLVFPSNPVVGFAIQFNREVPIECLALLFPRNNDPDPEARFDPPMIGGGDVIRHRLGLGTALARGEEPSIGDDIGDTGLVYDTGLVTPNVDPGYGYHVLRLPQRVSARWWRVDISAPSRISEEFIDVSRAWAGPVFEPARNFNVRDSEGWAQSVDASQARRGLGEFISAGETRQNWTITFGNIQDDRAAWQDFERLVGAAGRFLIVRP
ncbi:MAG: hypothetical protein K2X34_13195, partial [Hyphomonadaceae bacterium]|nr:hypothetical protein [Hyphomonadaceae bacterium]